MSPDSKTRKQKSRGKLKSMGVKIVEVKLSAAELAVLDESCIVRGGVRGAYSRDEYISTLIRKDAEKLKCDMSQIKKCNKCDATLPNGCEGVFKGDADCFHHHNYKALAL